MRIGIVSPWFERGIAYISLAMRNVLAEKHEVFVLARPGQQEFRGAEFDVPNLFYGSHADYKFPLAWARKHGIDTLIFNERLDCRNLSPLREEHGLTTLCLLEWEYVPDTAKAIKWIDRCYSTVIAPTYCSWKKFVEMGLRRVGQITWGVDLEKFRPPDRPREGPIKFLQPANFGGQYGRKNVKATRRAWALADTGDAELYIHTQRSEWLTHKQMAEMYRKFDVVLLPSMWEGLGLCFIEALASGCAILTVDAPPMNEYVSHAWNGYLCKTKMAPPASKIIHVQRAMIDVEDYAQRIEWMAHNPYFVRKMAPRSRHRAELRHDWYVRAERLLHIVESAHG